MTARTSPVRPRVAGYVRLSRETDASTSPQRQRALIASLCEARGWDLVETFEDLGRSGGSMTARPALASLLDRLGEFDIVAVWKLDRLARSVADLATLLATFEAEEVALVAEAEPFDMTTPMGRAMAQVSGVFGELELATIRERIRSGQAELLRTGRWKGGARPFGWHPVPHASGSGYWLALHPTEASILREAIDRVLAGASCSDVASWLNGEGVPAPQSGGRWSRTAVRHALIRRGLLGHATAEGETVYDENGSPVLAAEPLVTREEFDRLAEAVAVRRRRTASGEVPYLAGLIRCAHCGNRLWHKPRRRTLKRTGETVTDRMWQCSATRATDYDGPPCPGCAIMAEPLAAEVERLFLATFGRVPVIERREVTDQHAEEREALTAALEDLSAALVRIRSETARATLLAQVAALDERLSALGPEVAPHVIERDTGETFADLWHRSTPRARERLLADAVGAVFVSKAADRSGRVVGRVTLGSAEHEAADAERAAGADAN